MCWTPHILISIWFWLSFFFCCSSNFLPSRDAADDHLQHTLDEPNGKTMGLLNSRCQGLLFVMLYYIKWYLVQIFYAHNSSVPLMWERKLPPLGNLVIVLKANSQCVWVLMGWFCANLHVKICQWKKQVHAWRKDRFGACRMPSIVYGFQPCSIPGPKHPKRSICGSLL